MKNYTLFLAIGMLLSSIDSVAQPGSLDSTFSGDGKVRTKFRRESAAYSIAIQADGKIVAAGTVYDSANSDCAIIRYKLNGDLDSTFGQNGKVTTDIGISEYAHSITIQTDGKIVVVGSFSNGWDYDFALVRYTQNGKLDSSFGKKGKVTTDLGLSD